MPDVGLDPVSASLIRTCALDSPATLAEALSLAPGTEVREVIKQLDDEALARVAEHASPWWLVRGLEQTEAVRVAHAVAAKGTNATAIRWLRTVSTSVCAAAIDLLSEQRRGEITRGLARPSHVVGSWCETRIASAVDDASVEDVRRSMASVHPRHADHVWMIDRAGCYLGQIPVWRLFGVEADTRISTLADPRSGMLLETTALETVLNQVNWQQRPFWPVVAGGGHFLGVVGLAEVLRGLGRLDRVGEQMSLVTPVVEAWLNVLTLPFDRSESETRRP